MQTKRVILRISSRVVLTILDTIIMCRCSSRLARGQCPLGVTKIHRRRVTG